MVQNSTEITGALTGQIVMGFLRSGLPQWISFVWQLDLFALLPCHSCLAVLFGHQREKHWISYWFYSTEVFLSDCFLPFSIFPLIYLTSKKSPMGEFTNAQMEYHPWLYRFHYLNNSQCEVQFDIF